MHIYIYHYISIDILSKGLNPQISTPKLSIVFACLEISPDWHHGGWCVPVPLSAQLRPCHQSRGGEAGTMVQPPASAALEAGGCWPLDSGHWPSTRHIWIVLGNRGTPGTGRTVRFLLHYNIRLFDFIMNGYCSELAQSIAVHAFSLPGITVVVWPSLPLGVVQRLEHAVLARSHGRLVRIVSDCPGPVVILGNIVTRIPLPFSFAKSIDIKLFIRF